MGHGTFHVPQRKLFSPQTIRLRVDVNNRLLSQSNPYDAVRSRVLGPDLLQHLIHGLQRRLTQSVDLRSWDISKIYSPTNFMLEVLGFLPPLVGLKESSGWV